MIFSGIISVLQCFCEQRKSPRLCLTVFFVKKYVISMNYIFITSLTVENVQSANVMRAGSSVVPLRRASLHFPHPFCCDWLRPAPASFRPESSLCRMCAYRSAGTAFRKIRASRCKSRSSPRLTTKPYEKGRLVPEGFQILHEGGEFSQRERGGRVADHAGAGERKLGAKVSRIE